MVNGECIKRHMYLVFALTVILSVFSSVCFAEFISPGKLTESHKKLSGLKQCVKCHSLRKGVSDYFCKLCHEKLMDRINRKKGFHATVEGKCSSCHTDHKGEDFDIMAFDMDLF